MKGKSKIYYLKDPRDLSVKYIGRTISELYDRKKVHVRQSKVAIKPSKKEDWIKQLLLLDLRPIIELIEEVDELTCIEREIFWIAQYDNLTNSSTGGIGGCTGVAKSEENKKAISERMKGNKFNIGQKWTENQRELMKNRIPWNKGKKGLQKHDSKWREEASKRKTGEKHPMSKLTNKQVVEIRNKHAQGIKPKDIAREYLISYEHTLKIIKNKIRNICQV